MSASCMPGVISHTHVYQPVAGRLDGEAPGCVFTKPGSMVMEEASTWLVAPSLSPAAVAVATFTPSLTVVRPSTGFFAK